MYNFSKDQSESVSSKMLGHSIITVVTVDCTWLIMCSRFCVQRLRPRISIPHHPKKNGGDHNESIEHTVSIVSRSKV